MARRESSVIRWCRQSAKVQSDARHVFNAIIVDLIEPANKKLNII